MHLAPKEQVLSAHNSQNYILYCLPVWLEMKKCVIIRSSQIEKRKVQDRHKSKFTVKIISSKTERKEEKRNE